MLVTMNASKQRRAQTRSGVVPLPPMAPVPLLINCEVCGFQTNGYYDRVKLAATHQEQHRLVLGLMDLTRDGWVLLVDEGRTRMTVRRQPTKALDAYEGLAAIEQVAYQGVETRSLGPWVFTRREEVEKELAPFRLSRPAQVYPSPVEAYPKSLRLLATALYGAQRMLEVGFLPMTNDRDYFAQGWTNERAYSGARGDWFTKMIKNETITI